MQVLKALGLGTDDCLKRKSLVKYLSHSRWSSNIFVKQQPDLCRSHGQFSGTSWERTLNCSKVEEASLKEGLSKTILAEEFAEHQSDD